MKKIDFYQPIMTLKNEPVLGAGGKTMYMTEVIANMLTVARAKKSATGQLILAMKIYNSKGPMDVEDEDLDIIKEVVKEAGSSALIQGQIEIFLKGKSSEDKK